MKHKWWHCPKGHIFTCDVEDGMVWCIGDGCEKQYKESDCVRDIKDAELGE